MEDSIVFYWYLCLCHSCFRHRSSALPEIAEPVGCGPIRLELQKFGQCFDGAAAVAANYANDEEQAMFSGEAMLYHLLLLYALLMAPSVPPLFHAQFAT